MPAKRNDNIYTYVINHCGLLIELTSDCKALLKIDFIKNKKIKQSHTIPEPVKAAVTYLDDYFHHRKSNVEIVFSTVNSDNSMINRSGNLFLDMTGYTEKEILIYRTLLKIKSGKKISYSELASLSGIPRGARFAGNCMAGNRFPIIIPCHRVIKQDGSMGNYTGGVEIKELLLKHEMK